MFDFSGPWKKCLTWSEKGSGGFCPTNPDLADILGDTDFDFEICYFCDFFRSQIPRFPGSRFTNFKKSGQGQAWAGLGSGLGRVLEVSSKYHKKGVWLSQTAMEGGQLRIGRLIRQPQLDTDIPSAMVGGQLRIRRIIRQLQLDAKGNIWKHEPRV